MTKSGRTREQMLAMNEALTLGSVRQHELTEAAESLNARLQKEIAERKLSEEASARLAAIVEFRTTPSSAKTSTASSPVGTQARNGCSATRLEKRLAGPSSC